MSGAGKRPERSGTADAFYSSSEANRYDGSVRMAVTQRHLAERALQLLALPEGAPSLVLDVGCGTGYSARPLAKAGHAWIGTDISVNMLRACRSSRGGGAQVVCSDVGCGLGFQRGVFDGCVSISAVQWLCHATKPEHEPARRVRKFFRGLKAVLVAGARAVLQVYPEQPDDMMLLRDSALAEGFGGGLVVDYPWSERSKKLFLVLIAPPRPPPRERAAPRSAVGKGGGRAAGGGRGGRGGAGKKGKGKGGGKAGGGGERSRIGERPERGRSSGGGRAGGRAGISKR